MCQALFKAVGLQANKSDKIPYSFGADVLVIPLNDDRSPAPLAGPQVLWSMERTWTWMSVINIGSLSWHAPFPQWIAKMAPILHFSLDTNPLPQNFAVLSAMANRTLANVMQAKT